MKMKKNTAYPSSLVVLQAMRKAIKRIAKERKNAGVSLSIWRDGKVVSIPAAKITVK